MTSFKNWVVETSSTTGTGAYALSGSPPAGTSYFTFRQRYANGDDEVVFWVVNKDRTKMEKNRFGTLTYGSPDQLSRNVVESTNGDAPVFWTGGDTPLVIYCVPDAEAEEFAISMGLGAARPDILKYGQWAEEDGLDTGFDRINHFDGTSDDPIGVVNRTSHQATIYGLPPGYLYGMTLSRSSATVLGIAAGLCMDSTNEVGIKLTSAVTKSTAGAWAAGSGQNGMADGVTIGNNTWYHAFAGLADGIADVFIDSDVAGANAPNEFTHFRRIGSFKTNGSAQIIAFTQVGDEFFWSATVQDVNAASVGTTAGNLTLGSVPTGVKVRAKMRIICSADATDRVILFYSPEQGTQVPNTPAGNISMIVYASIQVLDEFEIFTNASAQIAAVSSVNSVTVTVNTFGWTDRRGRDG